MKSRLQGCLIAGVIVLLIASLFINLGLIGALALNGGHSRLSESAKFEEELIDGKDQGRSLNKSQAKIAVVDLTGIISVSLEGASGGSMVDEVVGKLRQVREDDSIKAVVLRIDSPGGEVNASDIIYHEVAKTRAVKPVVVYMSSVAASGGFYAAMGSNYIMASDLTITASIGVILQTVNYKDLIQKIGVKSVTFKSGKFKDLLNGGRDMTPEEEKFVQDMIDDTYNKFVGIVAKERKLDVNELKNGIADGRILSGAQAKDAKLIDGLGYMEDAITKAKEMGKSPDAIVVRLKAPFNFAQLFRLMGKSEVKSLKIQVGPETLTLETGKLYFLSMHLFTGM